MTQAVALTASERATMVHSAGSKEAMRSSAVRALSAKVFTAAPMLNAGAMPEYWGWRAMQMIA